MHSIFLPTADFDPWRTDRVFSACRAFANAIDPTFEAQARYIKKKKVGWTFFMTNDEASQRLRTFYSGIIGKVIADAPYGDPVIQGGYDASSAIYPR